MHLTKHITFRLREFSNHLPSACSFFHFIGRVSTNLTNYVHCNIPTQSRAAAAAAAAAQKTNKRSDSMRNVTRVAGEGGRDRPLHTCFCVRADDRSINHPPNCPRPLFQVHLCEAEGLPDFNGSSSFHKKQLVIVKSLWRGCGDAKRFVCSHRC